MCNFSLFDHKTNSRSLILVGLGINWIMERVATRTGFSLGNDHFTDLDYADGVVLLAHKMDDMNEKQRKTTASQLGLHDNLGRRRSFRIWVRVNLHLAYQFAATRWKK